MKSGFQVRVGPKGRVVIPAPLREEAGLSVGDSLVASMGDDGRIVLESREAIKRRLHASAAAASEGREGNVVDRLRADRQADIELELVRKGSKRPGASRTRKA